MSKTFLQFKKLLESSLANLTTTEREDYGIDTNPMKDYGKKPSLLGSIGKAFKGAAKQAGQDFLHGMATGGLGTMGGNAVTSGFRAYKLKKMANNIGPHIQQSRETRDEHEKEKRKLQQDLVGETDPQQKEVIKDKIKERDALIKATNARITALGSEGDYIRRQASNIQTHGDEVGDDPLMAGRIGLPGRRRSMKRTEGGRSISYRGLARELGRSNPSRLRDLEDIVRTVYGPDAAATVRRDSRT